MPNNSDNVLVGVTGKIFNAPKGVPLPTNATADPDPGFIDVGYISEDGVSQTINNSTTQVRAWGGDTVRVIQTEHDVQYTFTYLETNPEVLKDYYNDPDATAEYVKITAAQAPRRARVIDVKDGDNLVRLCIPDSQVSEVGDITYATEEVIGYEITIDCFPDADGVKVHKRMASVA